MDALVMCGGEGTRLETDVEKPLFEVGGRSMVDRVLDALAGSRVEGVHAAVSPHVPNTRAHLDCDLIETPGEGYVDDLTRALEAVETPVLTVAADLPLLGAEAVDGILDAHEERVRRSSGPASTAVCVPVARKRSLGVSVDATFERDGRELAPAGINVVAEGEDAIHVTEDARLAVNVNRRSDAKVAEDMV